MTDRKKHEKQLEYLSFHDTLTGLPNRRLFSEHINHSLKATAKEYKGLALMFLDLDRFKQINDRFGHDAGDELLRQFSNRVKACIRNEDVLVRMGGYEFVILLPTLTNEVQVIAMAERILKMLQDPLEIHGNTLIITSSIGIALYEEGDNETKLLKKADIALYHAKSNGKNTYSLYHKIGLGNH